MQVRQQCPDPEQRDRNLSGQPLVTIGGGALPLPMPTQPATLTATRVATKATSTFFIGIPLSFTPRDAHFVPRCTVGRPRKPMVHRLRRQWGTSKGTVSLGTQLRGVRSKTCQRAAGWCGFNSPVFSAATPPAKSWLACPLLSSAADIPPYEAMSEKCQEPT